MTPKQARFVAEYLIDLNATQAAIRAGYSARNADVVGPRLLGNVGIAAAVADGQKALYERLGASAERVMYVNQCILNADPADAYGAEKRFLHPTEMPERFRLALKKWKLRIENVTAGDGAQDTTVEVEIESKSAALERDYKRHGLLIEQVKHSGGIAITHEVPE